MRKVGFIIIILLFIFSSITSTAINTNNDFQSTTTSSKDSINSQYNDSTWPMYQYNKANTGFSPSSFTDSLNLSYNKSYKDILRNLWAFQSAPIVANNKIFISGGGMLPGMDVIALYENNGSLIWQTSLPLNYSLIRFMTYQTPVFSEGKIFVCYGTIFSIPMSKIFALDENTGEIIWENRFFTSSGYSSLTISDDKVIIGGHFTSFIPISRLYAFDVNNGDLVWSKTMLGFIESTPAISNDMVFTITSSKSPMTRGLDTAPFSGRSRVFAFDLNNGNRIWKTRVAGHVIMSSPVVSNGKILVPSNIISEDNWNRRLTCLDIQTSEEIWYYQIEQNELFSAWPTSISTPAVAYGKIFFNDASGFIIALDEETGELLWEGDIIEEVNAASTCAYVPPVVVDNKVITTSDEADMHHIIHEMCMFNVSNGEKICSLDLGDLHGIISPFSIANGKLFVNFDENVYVYN